jgi:5'-nucleotidase
MGRDYYWLSGHAIEDGEATDSDVFAVASGYISVTPILFNMTDGELLKTLEKSPIAHLAG